MDSSQEAVARHAARALRESAQRNKRASQFHRRAAKKDMSALEKLTAACLALGIKLSEDA